MGHQHLVVHFKEENQEQQVAAVIWRTHKFFYLKQHKDKDCVSSFVVVVFKNKYFINCTIHLEIIFYIRRFTLLLVKLIKVHSKKSEIRRVLDRFLRVLDRFLRVLDSSFAPSSS